MDNTQVELWAETIIFTEGFFTILQGDGDNPPNLVEAALYLKDELIDTCIEWLKDNPEEAIVAIFGMEEYRKCRIDPSWITTAYDEASKIVKAAEYGFAIQEVIEAIGDIETLDGNKESPEYRDALGKIGTSFLGLTSSLVGEIPLVCCPVEK